MNDETPPRGNEKALPEAHLQEEVYQMALTLHDLPTQGYIRRTPPTFIPLSDPNPMPTLSLDPSRVPAQSVIADELPPCRCRRCHRLLRSVPSIAAGIGPACARKEGMAPTALPLFDGLEAA